MIRLMADADLHNSIVGGCRRREPAMDFLSANDAALEGLSDPEVLALAAAHGRILVSHDFRRILIWLFVSASAVAAPQYWRQWSRADGPPALICRGRCAQ